MPTLNRFFKQPDETLDYLFDFSQWVPAGDSISTASVASSDPSLTLGAMTIENSGTWVRQFISAGNDGGTYQVTCTITTLQGRIKECDVLLQVGEV